MIQANELRVGNWFLCEGQYWKYEETDMPIVWYQLEKLFPIPLTPEILERCGFKKDGICWYDSKSTKGDEESAPSYNFIQEGDTFDYFFQSDYYGSKSIAIKYLHQLQNLYFALTNQELAYDNNQRIQS